MWYHLAEDSPHSGHTLFTVYVLQCPVFMKMGGAYIEILLLPLSKMIPSKYRTYTSKHQINTDSHINVPGSAMGNVNRINCSVYYISSDSVSGLVSRASRLFPVPCTCYFDR